MNIVLIGCGGIGGWVAANFARSLSDKDTLLLVDGDTVEEHNLNRQLFATEHVGQNKAGITAHILGKQGCQAEIDHHEDYWAGNDDEIEQNGKPDVIICAVDNHACRRYVLDYLDNHRRVLGIFPANELIDASAFIYISPMQESALDPRVRYPEMLTDDSGDPIHPNCTGEAEIASPQLATANMLAASYAMALLYLWTVQVRKLNLREMPELLDRLPVELKSTATLFRQITVGMMELPAEVKAQVARVLGHR